MADTPQQYTPAQLSQAAQWAMLTGNTGPHAASAPPDQKAIAYFGPDPNNPGQQTLLFADNENYDQNAQGSTVYGNQQTGYFTVNKQGQPNVVMQPNQDYLITNAIGRMNEEGLIKERTANADAGRGYMTNLERQTKEAEWARLGLDQSRINEDIRQFDINQRNKDRDFTVNSQKIAQDIATGRAQSDLYAAQAVRTGAETQSVETATQISAAKAPWEMAEIQSRIEEARRKATQPTISSTEGPTITYTDPQTGEIRERPREGFVPKTQADVYARQAQMNQAMAAKSQQLASKIGDGYSAEQADADLKRWAQETLGPQQQVLQAAANDIAFGRAKDIASAQQQAMQTAQGAGTLAVNAFNAAAPRAVGPNAAQGISQMLNAGGKGFGRPDQDYSWMVTQQPNLMGQVNQQVQGALQQIGPQAMQQLGAMNNPQAIQAGLDVTPYLPSNRPAPPPGQQPAPAAPGALPQTPAITIPQLPQTQGPQAGLTNVPTATNPAGQPVGLIGASPWPAPAAPPPAAPAAAPPGPPPGNSFDPTQLWGSMRGQPMPYANAVGGTVPPAMTGFPSYPVSPWTPPIQGLNVNGLNLNGLNVNGLNLNSGNPQGANQPALAGLNMPGLNWPSGPIAQNPPGASPWNQQPTWLS